MDAGPRDVAGHARDVIGRYAPSPTGALHLGNLRTALLAWLFARSAGSRFAMRIDDLDAGRVRPGIAGAQLADLAALGLDWDPPVVTQSERLAVYADAIARLDGEGALYPCFCTRREIREAASAPHGPLAEGAYSGTCRELTAAARAERERAGRPPALRLRAGAVTVGFDDRLLGRVEATVDDVVVRRNDGAPAYHLAVVGDDDVEGGVEVEGGGDHGGAAPRQMLGGGRVGLPARLAKRHGAVTLADRLARGETAAAVRGDLAASVGLAEVGETPSMDVLLARFDPAALPAAPTVLAPT